jgi:hypothetical protein
VHRPAPDRSTPQPLSTPALEAPLLYPASGAGAQLPGVAVRFLRPAPHPAHMAERCPDNAGDVLSAMNHAAVIVGIVDNTNPRAPRWEPMPARCSRYATPTEPAVWLVRRTSAGRSVWHLVPADGNGPGDVDRLLRHLSRWMASGNYAATIDSGLSDAMGEHFYGAIAVHDQPIDR